MMAVSLICPGSFGHFCVSRGYFNQMQQYNPMLYAGFANMLPQPWQYGNPLPLFQSHNTFNPYTPPPQQQPQSGGGGFRVLPNFDQNGQIISIPQGVSWSPQENTWVNAQGGTSWQSPPPGFGDPSAGTPLSQYTGVGPWTSQPAPAQTNPPQAQPNTQMMP